MKDPKELKAEEIIEKYFSYNEFDKKRVIEAMEEYAREKVEETLKAYSEFLEDNGYTDSDWRDEKPTAIERYFKSKMK